jgi:hypothetical protein
MKGFVYVVALLLSLPNLLAGTASLIIRHSFATLNPLRIVTDFFFQMVWGVPLAAALFLLLLVFGIISRTRAHTALLAFILNATALGLVLLRFGLPNVFDKALFFFPLLLALIGFAWIASPIFVPKPEA